MNTKNVIFIIIAIIIGFIAGHFFFAPQPPFEADAVQSLLQSKNELYESAVQRCFQLAQDVYVRDFIDLCKKDQPSSVCDSYNFNSALGYGVYQLGANPTGSFALLYKTYQSDNSSCTDINSRSN